jgi:hypothetical protein
MTSNAMISEQDPNFAAEVPDFVSENSAALYCGANPRLWFLSFDHRPPHELSCGTYIDFLDVKLTIDVQPEEAKAVVAAVRNHASYAKGNTHNSIARACGCRDHRFVSTAQTGISLIPLHEDNV